MTKSRIDRRDPPPAVSPSPDLSPAIDLDERNAAIGGQQMRGVAGLAERENGRMFDEPDFV